jgi:hypothetical protein
VRGIQQFYFPQGSPTLVCQFPHLGNMIHVTAQSENPVSTITDGDGNTYQTSAGERETQTSVAGIESWRALNVTPNTDLRTISISASGPLNLNEGMMHLYDIQGADTVQGSGGKVQTVIANGQQLAVTDLQTVSITPINQNALIIFAAPVEAHTLNALTIPTAANGGNFDGQTSDTQDGSGGLTNDDGWGHWYNGSSISATTITYGIQPGGVAVNNWAAFATEYMAAAFAAGKINNFSRFPKLPFRGIARA